MKIAATTRRWNESVRRLRPRRFRFTLTNQPSSASFCSTVRGRSICLIPFCGFPFDRHESSNTYETYLVRAIPIRRVVWPGKHNAKWHRLIRFRPIQAIIQLWLTNEFDSPTGARSQPYFQSAGRLIKIIRVCCRMKPRLKHVPSLLLFFPLLFFLHFFYVDQWTYFSGHDQRNASETEIRFISYKL